jgi:hypothetical protein
LINGPFGKQYPVGPEEYWVDERPFAETDVGIEYNEWKVKILARVRARIAKKAEAEAEEELQLVDVGSELL